MRRCVKPGSDAYITGFHYARHSGMKEAGNYLEHVVKDRQRFEEDAEYRTGWLAGEQEGIRIQQQADAAVGTAEGIASPGTPGNRPGGIAIKRRRRRQRASMPAR
jgi:hypothetical protein